MEPCALGFAAFHLPELSRSFPSSLVPVGFRKPRSHDRWLTISAAVTFHRFAKHRLRAKGSRQERALPSSSIQTPSHDEPMPNINRYNTVYPSSGTCFHAGHNRRFDPHVTCVLEDARWKDLIGNLTNVGSEGKSRQ
eukprot:g33514.t1